MLKVLILLPTQSDNVTVNKLANHEIIRLTDNSQGMTNTKYVHSELKKQQQLDC